MRLLVNLLLVALTATGPSVCCCTAATVSHAAFGRSHKAAGLQTKGPPRYCCPTHNRKPVKAAPRKARGQPTAGSSERPGQPPEDRSCPCQEQRPVPVVSLAGEGDVRPHLGSRDYQSPAFLPADFVLLPGTCLDRHGATGHSAPRLPFMSADERLCAHHALRC